MLCSFFQSEYSSSKTDHRPQDPNDSSVSDRRTHAPHASHLRSDDKLRLVTSSFGGQFSQLACRVLGPPSPIHGCHSAKSAIHSPIVGPLGRAVRSCESNGIDSSGQSLPSSVDHGTADVMDNNRPRLLVFLCRKRIRSRGRRRSSDHHHQRFRRPG